MSVADEHEVKPRDPDNPSIASHNTSNDDQISDPLNNFVPPYVLEQEALSHDHSSQTIKNWLLGFGQQKQGTNVSLRFKIDEADYPSTPPHSLVPILTKWLRAWFDRSLHDSQDRSNLSWLLQYTADYLELGHHSLDEGEMHHLCLALLFICENARQHSHLEGCLAVFLSIAQVGCFPKDCLQQTIKILTTASVILDRPLPRIGTCVQILASGALHEATLKALYAQLSMLPQIHSQKATHEEQDFSSYLTPARGAARHLSALLNEHLENEKPILDLEQTLQVLKEACEVRILRFVTEVLALLTNLLRGSRREELLASDYLLSLTLDVYIICKESNTIHDIGDASLSKTKSAKEEILARERRYKRDHALAVRKFQEATARALLLMTDAAASRAWGLIREHLDDLSGSSRLNAIEYVKKQNICLPSSGSGWAQNLFILIDRLLIGKQSLTDNQVEDQLQPQDSIDVIHLRDDIQHRIRLRVDVLHLCAEAIGSAAANSFEETDLPDTVPSCLDVGVKALKMILQVPHGERNGKFTQAFFEEMVKLCDIESNGQYPYASMIIQSLEKQILMNARDDHASGEVFLAATECLRRIFLQGLGSTSSISNEAYQSLLRVANCNICKSRRCRLAAMSLLFRLRCDTSGIVYIEASDDSAYIAGALCKTEESLNAMFSEAEAESDEATRRSSSVSSNQLWMYPQEATQISEWIVPEILKIQVKGCSSPQSNNDLNLSDWLWLITTNLQEDRDWETYSYAIVHLGSQLMNTRLFEHSLDILTGLRGFLCGRVRERKSMFEPPRDIGLDKSDIALCFYHILTRMIPYYKLQPPNPHMRESRKGIDLVRAFRTGIAGDVYYGTARSCIHALAICCYETPEAIGSEYPSIIEAMAKTVSTPHVLVHILEFLAQVARLPNLHRHFMEEEVRGIFGICIAALKSLMSKDEPKGPPSIDSKDSKRGSAQVSISSHRGGALHTPFRAAMLKEKGLKQYSCALAYHTMIFWFLSIPIGQRHKYVKEVTKQLTWNDTRGNSTIDEQTIVLIDLMQRTAFSDLPETARDESFSGDDYETTSFIDGNSVLTIETHKTTGRSQITKRQAAGTTHAIYEPRIQPLPPHHDRAFYNELERRGYSDQVTPSHTFLNMIGSAVPMGIHEQPLKLNPSEGYVARAIRSIDHQSTVDSHKIAVTLLKEGQIAETDYLANTKGSKSFDEFLDHIGTRVSLKPPCPFTPFGLLYEIDGTETIAWRDRINEVVFEISTLMPNVEADTYQARKKSHMGNCLVLVVFNQSNQCWKWDWFESQVTLVNIVITPANRVSRQDSSDDFEHEYFQVEVHTKEEYQNISAAAETKVVSKATLAPFVRMLALNANIFSECARNELTGDNEFPSSWRYRMQEIIKLRERTQQRVHDDGDTLAKRYDFSRWT